MLLTLREALQKAFNNNYAVAGLEIHDATVGDDESF